MQRLLVHALRLLVPHEPELTKELLVYLPEALRVHNRLVVDVERSVIFFDCLLVEIRCRVGALAPHVIGVHGRPERD